MSLNFCLKVVHYQGFMQFTNKIFTGRFTIDKHLFWWKQQMFSTHRVNETSWFPFIVKICFISFKNNFFIVFILRRNFISQKMHLPAFVRNKHWNQEAASGGIL